jgi:CheY-like chemotaxis protein
LDFRIERETIKLVLLDYFMPELNGTETLSLLKKLKPSIKIIIVSGAKDPLLRCVQAEHQFDGCLRKPFELSEALRTI